MDYGYFWCIPGRFAPNKVVDIALCSQNKTHSKTPYVKRVGDGKLPKEDMG